MPARPNDKRREQLLDELEALMLAEGFARLRVGTLAKRLKCSRSTLYKLAPSKEELFSLVFERYVRKAIDDSDARASQLPATADRVIVFMQLIANWVAQGSPSFWRDVRDDPEMAAVLSMQRGRGWRVVQRYLGQGVESGEVRPVPTEFIAYVAYMASVAIRDADLMAQFGLSTEEAFHELGQLLVRGVCS
jgi:AcrR family transcriptional regulator